MAVSDETAMFAAQEMLDAHAQLDQIGVPRRSPDGEPLSISQRCAESARMYVALLAAGNVLMKAAQR